VYDYIIIGAGSAGCAVAARLSESGEHTVLLLEAGGADSHPAIAVPAAFPSLFKSEVDWNYETTPQAHAGGLCDFVPRGKVLGGSSAINAMIYQRGHASIYDRWAALGNPGWSYADVLPLFKKSEHQERGASGYHGVGGPLNVADLRDPSPLSLAFVQAAEQLGLPVNRDFNGERQEGFGLYQVTQKNGVRCSAAAAYLRPAAARANLTITTAAHVTRLLFERHRCVGVAYVKDGQAEEARARREIIVSGGAINSPQILMLSGIGPAAHLDALGIPVVRDMPGVGQHLMDHLMVPLSYHCLQPISLAAAQTEEQQLKFQTEQRGMLTSNVGEAGGFIKLDPNASAPELQFHFGPTWFLFHGFKNPPGHGFTLLPSLVGTRSVGQVTLRSANPLDAPLIDPNYLAEEDDLRVLVEGVKLARRLLRAPAFDVYRGEEYTPGKEVQTDAEIAAYVRGNVQNIYHLAGTCKMGHGPSAVVDHELRVHGIQGLRVADASIMPVIVNANTNAPSIMIGEKAAEMVLGSAS
jgi:choline dehydrogenase